MDIKSREYVEPTNEQLANWLMLHAATIPELTGLQLNPLIMQRLMDQRPAFREGALRHHRRFQEKLWDLRDKRDAGELQCAFVRDNGKRCPNHNDPGSYYCGIPEHSGELDELSELAGNS